MDKLGVINLALMKCGLPLAANLDDCDYNAASIFENVAEELLRAHLWGFARKFARLEEAAGGHEGGYAYAYLAPADLVGIFDVREVNDIRAPRGRYEWDGNVVFCNVRPCYARYVRRELNPEKWSPDFRNAVAQRIAAEIAGLSAEKMALVPQLMQLYDYWLARAMANDAREMTDRVPLDDSLYTGRGAANVG